MANFIGTTCLVVSPKIKELARKITEKYPEACNRAHFDDKMCANWVGRYITENNINDIDFIPSVEAIVNAVEKWRNKDSKSFLRDLEAEERQRAIEQEMQSIKEKALADGTFMKAPNGKDTNLTERQWLQVRTKAFKKWFGDWENDPENASKVVDENGEPSVVYHGATFTNDIKIFNPQTSYFTENKVEADKYGDKFRYPQDNSPKSIPVFLNIRNPHIFNAEGREYNNINNGVFVTFDEFLESHPEYQNESWYWKYQIGEEGLNIPKNVMDAYHKVSTSKTVRTYVSENIGKNNDGVIVKNVLDPADGNTSKSVPITDYVPNSSNQIKSAIDNSGEFSTENDSMLASPQAYEEIPVEILSEMADKEASRTAYDSVESSDSDLDKKFGNKTDITVSELLDNLLKSETPFSEFVKALKDNIGEIGNIQVKLVPNSNSKVYGLGGLYSTLDNTIYINRNAQFKGKDGKVDNTVLHEIVHAIVANSLNTAEHREELGKIFDEAKEKILKKYGVESFDELPEYLRKGRLYGLQNLDEFAAEFFTNSEFILELNDENTFGKRSDKQSIISKLVEWIKSLLSKGVTETYKRSGEILEDIILNSGGSIQTNRNLLAGNSSAANTQSTKLSTPDSPLQVYSDGSDFKGTGKIGYGSVFELSGRQYGISGTEENEEVKKLQKQFPDAKFSNPTMEMLALATTLEYFANRGNGENIVINQDYKGACNYQGLWEYSEGSAQRDPKAWKAKEPYIKHLVDRSVAAIEKINKDGGSVKINWVKGHQTAGTEQARMNDAADKYAKSRDNSNTMDDAYPKQQSQQPAQKPSTIDPRFKQGIETLTGYYEGGGRLLTDDFPGVPEELDDKLNNHFMGGEELSDDDYRELAKYISVVQNTDANTSQGWPYIAAPKKQATQQQRPSNKSSFNISQAEFYSGDAMGSDRAWAREARKLGIKVTDYTVGNWDVLPQSEKDKYDKEYREVANQMGRKILDANSYNGRLVRRDMMQADSADAIFAIGTIDSRGYVDGGTGYATTRGIIRNIPVYVYDRRNKQWKIWSTNSRKFIPIPEPTLTPHAAVIGTRGDVIGKDLRGYDIRDIKEEEKQVIRNILAKTVGQQSQQEQQQPTQQQTTTTNRQSNGEQALNFGFTSEELAQAAEDRVKKEKKSQRPISPSFETALNAPADETKEFYNAFSPQQIVDRARMIAKKFSDAIDDIIIERKDHYQSIIDDSSAKPYEKENARRSLETYKDPILARQAAVKFMTYDIIMDNIKNDLETNGDVSINPEIKQKYQNTVRFFDKLKIEASKWIEDEEGIRPDGNNTSEEEEQDGEDFGDNDAGNATNGNEGWSFKERFNNPFRALSKQVKRVLCGIEIGEVDDLGNDKYYSQGYIYSAMMSYLSRHMETADDFMQLTREDDYEEGAKDMEGLEITPENYPYGYPKFPILEKMAVKYPWANQVIERLTKDWRTKDEEDGTQLKFPPTYGSLASQFYTNFRKAFIPYAKIQVGEDSDGNSYFGVIPQNYDMEDRNQRDELETSYNNGITYSKDSLYNTDKTLNKENATKIIKVLDSLLDNKIPYMYSEFRDNMLKKYPIGDEYKQQAEEALNAIRAFGINLSKDNVKALLLEKENGESLKSMLQDLREIAKQVERLDKNKNYFLDIVDKYGNSIWDDFFTGRGFVSEVNYIQSFYDAASKKTRYSYSADNYLMRTMRYLFSKDISKQKRQQYLNEHFGIYEWYRDQSAPEGQGWKSLWLEKAYNDDNPREGLPYKNINMIDEVDPDTGKHTIRDYNNWTDADKYRVMLRSWDTSSDAFAYYLSPIFADSPISMTVRGPKYSRNELIDGTLNKGKYTPSGFLKLIDQELWRIKYVTEERRQAIEEGRVLPITNYEKNGDKFCFMPELNYKIFGPEGNMSLIEHLRSIKNTEMPAGDKEKAIRQAKIDAINRVLTIKFTEFVNEMPAEIRSELGITDETPIEDVFDSWYTPYINMVYANTQIVALTSVDPAFLKNFTDFQKRFKQVYASGGRLNTNSRYGKKFERVILVSDEKKTSRSFNQIRDVIDRGVAAGRIKSKERDNILKAFAFLKNKKQDGINVSDAQALRSLESYRAILDMMGKWDEKTEASYQRIINEEWNIEDFNLVLQTLKPFVYSIISKSDGKGGVIPVPVQHKNSELVMLAMYDMIAGGLKNSAKMRGINRFLREEKDSEGNPIGDLVQFESAGKSGNQGVININYSHKKVMDTVEDAEIKIINKNNNQIEDTIFLDDKKFKENTRDNTADNFDEIKTQLTEMLIGGKISQETYNKAIDQFEPTEKEVIQILKDYAIIKENGRKSINPEAVQEVPFEDWMLAQPTPEHHMDATAPQGSQGRNIVVADLPEDYELELEGKDGAKQKLKRDGLIDFYYNLIVENLLQDYASLKETFKDKKSLHKRVMELARNNPTYGRDFAEAFNVDDNGDFSLSSNSPTIFKKVQQLATSIIKNKIAVQKVNGAALIQASGIGLSEELNLVFDKNGKPVGAECYLPATSRRFFEAFLKDETINGEKVKVLDVEALHAAKLDKAVGFRIPTENKSSMLPIIVKGFSPQQNGSVIILPAEITSLSGSDFDVDKLFVMLSDFWVQEYDKKKAREDFAITNSMFSSILNGLIKAGNLSEEELEADEDQDWEDEAFKEWWNKNKEKYRLKKPRIRVIEYDFSKTPKENGRKARNTMLVQIMYKILTSQEGAENLFNPQHFDDVQEASKMMQIMTNDYLLDAYIAENNLTKDTVGDALISASESDLSDFVEKHDAERSPIYPQTFNYFHEQNMAGDALLAMFALQVSACAKFQRANINIKKQHQFTINGRTIQDVDRIFNGLGEHRLKNVSQFVGACADNGKNPNVTNYGATKDNAKMIAYLLRAGLSIKEAALVINQPIMQLPLWRIKKDYNLPSYRQDWKDNNVSSALLMKGILQPGELSESENRALAMLCYKVKEQSEYLAEMTTISRADSPNGGLPETFAKARVYKYRIDVFNGRQNTPEFPFEHIDEAISNNKINLKGSEDEIRQQLQSQKMSMLQGFYSLGIQSFDELLSPFFFMLEEKFDKMVTQEVLNNLPDTMPADDKAKVIEALYADFITYSLSGFPLFSDEENASTLKEKRDYYLKEFPKEFSRIVASNKDIRDTIGNILTINKNGRIVLRDGGQKAKGQNDEIMRRMTDLLYINNPENPESQEIANKFAVDLFIYSFFDNGLQFTSDSFSTKFSTQFCTRIEGYNDFLRGMTQNLTPEMVGRFIRQFYNNHPEIAVSTKTAKILNTDELRKGVSITINKHKNGLFGNPFYSKLRPYNFVEDGGILYILRDWNSDFIYYEALTRFGDSSKLYNMAKNNEEMAADYNYAVRENKKGKKDSWADFNDFMAERDMELYGNPDFNNAHEDNLLFSKETETPTTSINSSQNNEQDTTDKYSNGVEQLGEKPC